MRNRGYETQNPGIFRADHGRLGRQASKRHYWSGLGWAGPPRSRAPAPRGGKSRAAGRRANGGSEEDRGAGGGYPPRTAAASAAGMSQSRATSRSRVITVLPPQTVFEISVAPS